MWATCDFCGRDFRTRDTGGTPKLYCSVSCRDKAASAKRTQARVTRREWGHIKMVLHHAPAWRPPKTVPGVTLFMLMARR